MFEHLKLVLEFDDINNTIVLFNFAQSLGARIKSPKFGNNSRKVVPQNPHMNINVKIIKLTILKLILVFHTVDLFYAMSCNHSKVNDGLKNEHEKLGPEMLICL